MKPSRPLSLLLTALFLPAGLHAEKSAPEKKEKTVPSQTEKAEKAEKTQKAGPAEEFDVAAAAAKIDAMVEAMLAKQGLKPNEAIDDATFVRRAYLDIAGRIPTIEEAENFHGSDYPRKREQLITDLLESEGHMSHAYNFWADVLRINSGLGVGGTQAESAYQLWVKDAIEKNKPYDQFVRELVSARGMIWENGAVGYYIRDRGMPLDNMSNTVRIFLGTRLECAQCHNHPFDKWTQMDYYQMAAFSYGMDARQYDSENRLALSKQQREERTRMHVKATGNEKFPQIENEARLQRFTEDKKYASYLERFKMTDEQFRAMAKKSMDAYAAYEHKNRGINNAVNEIYNPLRYVKAAEVEKTLKLPHDYQYDDAKPNDPVSARTMFGKEIDLSKVDDSTIDAYAAWLTSKENPTFTRVIANRLWKRVFGHGVFEPVDELTDVTPVSNPELLAYLEEMMKTLDYDMRKYQEVLYNTKAYQRGANHQEMVMGEHYYFQGPLLRRMSAEQIWDSIVALALPEADGYRPRIESQVASVEKVRRIYGALENRSEKEYIAMVKEVGEVFESVRPREDKLRAESAKALEAGDKDRFQKLRNDLNGIRNETRKAVEKIAYKNVGEKVDGSDLLAAMGMSEMTMGANGSMMNEAGEGERVVLTKLPKPEMPQPPAGLEKNAKRDWVNRQRNDYKTYTSLVSQMARASELESPARRGHFLREFGQSDREVIENAAAAASVPQALNLLNGPMVEALTNQFAVFGRRLHEAGESDEKIRMIFQGMLTREPSAREMELSRAEVAEKGDAAYAGLVWTLLNTQQFLFVQ
ncbi:MAG: DUF1549 domain-containing protein [Verrucomicrobiales bacterium]|nr:DUF1549 domain-containing protein [Verrucomicrobiales bacterium]